MGSNGSTAHQSYSVTPSVAVGAANPEVDDDLTAAFGFSEPVNPAATSLTDLSDGFAGPWQPAPLNDHELLATRYDPDTRTLEAAYADGRLLGFTVSPEILDDFRQDIVTSDIELADAISSYRLDRCPTCGRFVGGFGHDCPGPGADDDVQTGAGTTRDATPQVLADLTADHAASLQAQEAARTADEDTSVRYGEQMEAFQQAYDDARARIEAGEPAVPYLTENATGGLGAREGGRGFGVEIEFDLPPHNQYAALQAIGRDLHAAGLTQTPRMLGYHQGRGTEGYTDNPDGWRLESDSSVAGEIVSPIMYDTPETWNNLAQVCEIVRRHGGQATARTGGHVHVSAGDYDHTISNHHRLISMVAEHEDTMYRLAQNPAARAHRGLTWCSPNILPSEGYTSLRDVHVRNSSHDLGVNMQSLHGRSSDHVEYRMWDGSLDPGVIQAQVKVSLGVTEAAFRSGGQQSSPAREPVGTHLTRNPRRQRLTGEAWQENTASFRRLVDTIFRREQDKAQATALFAATRWQRAP